MPLLWACMSRLNGSLQRITEPRLKPHCCNQIVETENQYDWSTPIHRRQESFGRPNNPPVSRTHDLRRGVRGRRTSALPKGTVKGGSPERSRLRHRKSISSVPIPL